MNDDERRLSIEDLAGAVGLPVRTVRFYIAEGLIPGPGSRGKLAAYGDEHLLRLRLVRRLAAQHVPLTEIRERMNGLILADVRALLDEEEQRATQALSPRDYVSELLGRARAPSPQSPPPQVSPGEAQAMRRALREPAPSALPSHEDAGRVEDFRPRPTQADAPARSRYRELLGRASHGVGSLQGFGSLVESGSPTWQRLELAPGVEMHVRADAAQTQRTLIERLMRAAKKK